MRTGDEAVKVLQSHVVFYKDDLVIGPLFPVADGLDDVRPLGGDAGAGVVIDIGLHAVDDLDAGLLRGAEGGGIALEDTVVRDGHGGMAPLRGAAHQGAGVGHGVHHGHVAVQMELDPLLRGTVHALDLLHRDHGFDVEQIGVFVGVENDVAPGHDGHAVSQFVGQGVAGLAPREDLAGVGVGVVGEGKVEDLVLAVPGVDDVHVEHIAPDDDLAVVRLEVLDGLRQIADALAVNGRCSLKVKRQAFLYPVGLLFEGLFFRLAGFRAGVRFGVLLHILIGVVFRVEVHDARELHLQPGLEDLGEDGLQRDVGTQALQEVGTAVGEVQDEFVPFEDRRGVIEEPVGRGTAALQLLKTVREHGKVHRLFGRWSLFLRGLLFRELEHGFDIVQL